MKNNIWSIIILVVFCSCTLDNNHTALSLIPNITESGKENLLFDEDIRTAHILVALCDNKYQGIVPVPAKIGNGQDPDKNLYWGAMYGIRTYFKHSKEWTLVRKTPVNNQILERLVFKHKTQDFYLIADAYDGKAIKQTTIDFLKSSAGQLKDTLQINNKILGINGNAKLLVYVGHDGLMDFTLDDTYNNADEKLRDVMILACYSKRFFSPLLEDCNVNPLVWSSHLMAPEAYLVHNALEGYIQKEDNEAIRSRAAAAYAKYQRCSLKAARNLLLTGW